MKKNRMMRLASVLLIMTLLSTSVISGTFAKYTSTFEASDTARVAKWGFGAAKFEIDLFDGKYDNVANTSGDDYNLIAPGTTKEASIKFIPDDVAAPEVAYSIDVSTDDSSISAAIKANPNIVWSFNNGKWGTWDELLAEIEKLSGNFSANYEADNFFGKTHTISWLWVFDETVDANGEVDSHNTYNNNDINDTNMGNLAVTETLEAKLVITITATQID